jgi:hypothetical protein
VASIPISEPIRQVPAGRLRPGRRGLPWRLFLCVSISVLAAAVFIGYVLWPRWPASPVAWDAPSLPITVAGVAFNVPPAAIRMNVQRRPGAHDRIDLAFLWPSLVPPGPAEKPAAPAPGAPIMPTRTIERVFVTIAAAGDTLAPAERVRTIYPRYASASAPVAGPAGLAVLAFREDSPYRGEDLIYDAQAPGNFLVRCTRNGAGPTPGICLFMQRIETADLVVRFPRDWLDDWRTVKGRIATLIANLRPQPH